MAKKPDIPCAGGCGKLLWSTSTSLPAGQRKCQECRRATNALMTGQQKCSRCQQALPLDRFSPSTRGTAGSYCRGCHASYMRERHQTQSLLRGRRPVCDDCGTATDRRRTPAGLFCDGCSAARRHARYSRKNYVRRTALRDTDITAPFIAKLWREARRCPMCSVKLTDKSNQPNSKHLDHIVPVVIGGTHTMGNVRIVCRTCNLSRPKDGSDLDGHQPTLWAQDPTLAIAVVASRQRRFCPACGNSLGGVRCWTCRPSRGHQPIAPEVGRKAAATRAAGRKWQDISDELGMSGPGVTYQAALKHGSPDDVAQWPRPCL